MDEVQQEMKTHADGSNEVILAIIVLLTAIVSHLREWKLRTGLSRSDVLELQHHRDSCSPTESGGRRGRGQMSRSHPSGTRRGRRICMAAWARRFWRPEQLRLADHARICSRLRCGRCPRRRSDKVRDRAPGEGRLSLRPSLDP